MATIQVRVDDSMKSAADALFASLGLDISTAMRMFLVASIDARGIPFEIKKSRPIEINDGFGSYICEYGHIHSYSKLAPKLQDVAGETEGPFDSINDLMSSLNSDD
ncbi:MAG: type II toxin-antitoxin system RelB/DinJ family antitoxin [Clostridiales Family XIII bacterium]|jgi:addiction module RelB/DinJ family antitoxin|nr:type II toxin-antitoxin system RelB/DinJ family antitoxin [Clostridiales Family XIII bacterium]